MSFTAKAVGLLGAAALVLVPAGVSAADPPAGSPAPATSPHMTPPRGNASGSSSSNKLYYHGGVSDGAAGTVGVETSPKVYVVFWGPGWGSNGSNDPSGEAPLVEGFLSGLGGSGDNWSTSTTQYCEAITGASTSTDCTKFASAKYVGAPQGGSALGGVWFDSSSAPSKPRQSQLAAEAVKAAAHFLGGNDTAAVNASVQYVVATAHGNNASGFGTSYCAWHSSTSSSAGDIAYTNLPYITDAGASCGANFVSGPKDGITIVEGHEYAETVTDQYPSGGWLDSGGAENGDKCAWINPGQPGGAITLKLSTGSFPVQALWSNATASCVSSY